MTQLIASLTRMSDRANPLLIRFVRQRLRSRVFLAVFCGVLGLATVFAITLGMKADATSGAGLQLYTALAAIWSFAAWVYEPMSVFRNVVAEHEEGTWSLVQLTGMRPLRYMGGILQGSLLQGVVYASAVAPFLLMAYLLGGIELSVVLVTMLAIPGVGLLGAAAALMAATTARSRGARTFVGLAVICLSMGVWALGYDGLWEGRSAALQLATITRKGWLVPSLLSINIWAAALVVILSVAATQLLPPTSNRSTTVRLVWFAVLLNFFMWAALTPDSGHARTEAMASFALFGSIWAGLLGFISVTEDWQLSVRQARYYRRKKRIIMDGLFGPGAASGRLVYLLLALGIAGLAMTGLSGTRGQRETFRVVLLLLSYGTIYLAIGDAIARKVPGPLSRGPGGRRVVVVLFFAVMTLIAVGGPLIGGNDARHLAMVSPIPGGFYATKSAGWRLSPLIFIGGAVSAIVLLAQAAAMRREMPEELPVEAEFFGANGVESLPDAEVLPEAEPAESADGNGDDAA